MKSFSILPLALLVAAWTGPISAASLGPQIETDMLLQIQEEAQNVSQQVPANTSVVKIPDSRQKCKNVFCYAEKSLNLTAKDIWHPRYKKLIHALRQYNKMKETHECKLNLNHTYRLKSLLETLDTCVTYALMEL